MSYRQISSHVDPYAYRWAPSI